MRKCFFFQSYYILKEVKSIHLTNLHSLCEQVARSSTPSAKQKFNQLNLFFSKKEKLYPHNSKRMESEECGFSICLKLGIYIMLTLISCNMLITTSVHDKYLIFFFKDVITS